MNGRNIKKTFIYFLSILTFFIIWSILGKIVNAPLILPPVNEVFLEIFNLLKTPIFWWNFLHTLCRVFLAFIISITTGTIIGILCGYFKTCKDFLDFPISFIRSTPVVALILVTMFWFNSNSVPIFVAVLMGFPIVVSSIIQGMEINNNDLMFMAKVYKLTGFEKFKYIKLADLRPFFSNALISVFGLTWKVVVAGEVLGLPKFGFGTLMNKAQVHLETVTVMGITIILVTFSFTIQKILTFFIKKGNKNV